MEYVVARFDDELYHHGIKGMKWGVRRYQNADGSLTAKGKAKVAKYKEKESNTLNKRHDRQTRLSNKYMAKREEQYKNAVSKYGSDSNKAKRKAEQYISESYTKHYNDKAFREEMNRVKKMSLSDVSEEKKAVGKAVTTAVLSNVGAIGLATVLRAPIIPIFSADVEAVKRNNRINSDGRTRIHNTAVEKATKDYERLKRNS